MTKMTDGQYEKFRLNLLREKKFQTTFCAEKGIDYNHFAQAMRKARAMKPEDEAAVLAYIGDKTITGE